MQQGTLDMDEVVRILRDRGVQAYVEQTGGGTATIYAGDSTPDALGDPRYEVLAGPGWFEGPNWTNARADLGDFYIGPDDDGEADPVVPDRSTATPATVAAEIMRQMGRVGE